MSHSAGVHALRGQQHRRTVGVAGAAPPYRWCRWASGGWPGGGGSGSCGLLAGGPGRGERVEQTDVIRHLQVSEPARIEVDVAFCPERIAEGKAMTELFDLLNAA